jgi:hypothetical protein
MFCADDYRVFGFLLNDKFLLDYALKQKLGTDKDEWQKSWVIGAAAEDILRRYKIAPCIIAGVLANGDVRTCVAIASEDPDDELPMPPVEITSKLQKLLQTKEELRWYRHA